MNKEQLQIFRIVNTMNKEQLQILLKKVEERKKANKGNSRVFWYYKAEHIREMILEKEYEELVNENTGNP